MADPRRQEAGSPEPVAGACGAKLRGTDPARFCVRPPLVEQKRCRAHGGRSPQAKQKAAQRVEVKKLLGIQHTYEHIDPATVLLDLVAAAAAEVKWLEDQVAELTPDALTWNEVQHRYGTSTEGPIDETTNKAVEHTLIVQLREARHRLADYATRALKAGVEERRVQMAEQHAALIFGVIQRALTRLDLTDEQRAQAAIVIPEELRQLEGTTP